MKLSKTPIAAILMVFAFCPLFIISQTAFAADEMSFSRNEEQSRPYVLIALIGAAALFGFAYQRIPTVRRPTSVIISAVGAVFNKCWPLSGRKRIVSDSLPIDDPV